MHKPNWDDLRFVLAVAEFGSVSQAAQQLGVNHATVLRRVAEFEHRHGVAIFEKTTRGYRVLADKRDIIKAAKSIQSAFLSVEQLAGGNTDELFGTLRVASTDTFCQTILPNILADLQRKSPKFNVEIMSANTHVDLLLQRVDVAVRPGIELSPELDGETAAELGFSVYTTDATSKDWLGMIGPITRSIGGRWMMDNIDPNQITASADSFYTLRSMAAQGLGHCILPCIIGDEDPQLSRLDIGMPHFTVPIWVASHIEAAKSSRVKALRDSINNGLSEIADKLRG